MLSDISLSAVGLSKSYRVRGGLAGTNTIREAVVQRLSDPFNRANARTFWALDDLSFEIRQGEAVAIIGANGAGKSTLLKVLSRITKPTRGRADTYGRVGSLLEVGTGFHPELTGRENVYLNGAILGMTRREIHSRFDEIMEFSGVLDFIDTPVKRYSSGMTVRLAFAVAAHLEADLLMVDEVLAVGDAEFQKRSMAKMNDVAQGGRTVIFVSHSLQAVASLCESSLVLEQGKLIYQGPTREAIAIYLGRLSSGDHAATDPSNREGSGDKRITAVTSSASLVDPGEPKMFDIAIADYGTYRGSFFVSADLHEDGGSLIAHMDSRLTGQWFAGGRTSVQLAITSPWLKPGKYFLDVFLCHPFGIFDAFRAACRFEVSPMLPYEGMGVGEDSAAPILADFTFS